MMNHSDDKKKHPKKSNSVPFRLTMEFYRNLAEHIYDHGGGVKVTKGSEVEQYIQYLITPGPNDPADIYKDKAPIEKLLSEEHILSLMASGFNDLARVLKEEILKQFPGLLHPGYKIDSVLEEIARETGDHLESVKYDFYDQFEWAMRGLFDFGKEIGYLRDFGHIQPSEAKSGAFELIPHAHYEEMFRKHEKG